jgi:hypothetical protein
VNGRLGTSEEYDKAFERYVGERKEEEGKG